MNFKFIVIKSTPNNFPERLEQQIEWMNEEVADVIIEKIIHCKRDQLDKYHYVRLLLTTTKEQ